MQRLPGSSLSTPWHIGLTAPQTWQRQQGAIWVACYNTGECLRMLDGGEITHRIAIEGNGISCTLGGPDRTTLFFTAFLGTDADMAAGKLNSVVLSIPVEVPGVD